jgi:hypothetical protein
VWVGFLWALGVRGRGGFESYWLENSKISFFIEFVLLFVKDGFPHSGNVLGAGVIPTLQCNIICDFVPGVPLRLEACDT